MSKLTAVLLISLLVCAMGVVFAQEPPHEHSMAAPAHGPKLEKARLQEVWDAWATLDPKNAAKFYGQGAEHTFFDVSPLKYQGWAAYEKGGAEFLKTIKSMTAKINDDLQIHNESAGVAWTTATVEFSMVGKDGKTMQMPLRWTAIWHNHGKNWVIAHEHVSAPLPEEPPKS